MNPDLVRVIGSEYEYGNSIREIVEFHNHDFNRHKVYAVLDYLNIPRRNNPNDWEDKLANRVDKVMANHVEGRH
jgi:hypothetical protein